MLALLGGSLISFVAFVAVERRSHDPMFRLPLFKIRAFTFGTLSTFLASVARGGLMFILIIWLQGIWLPQHGYSFTETPLYAGLYMAPFTVGMLLAGPTSGILSDRYGARLFATGGMVLTAACFGLLAALPTNFAYWEFAVILFLMGASMGMFASPNRAAVMNSLPRGDRRVGGAMNQTFQNSAQVLSIGIFFTLRDGSARSSRCRPVLAGSAPTVHPAEEVRSATSPGTVLESVAGALPSTRLSGAHLLDVARAESDRAAAAA